MHTLDLPAGAGVRLTANARPDRDVHLWDVHLWDGQVSATTGKPLLVYRSHIGGKDVHQVIEVPAQHVDCRLELRSRHMVPDGWAEDQMSTQEDGPTTLRIGFRDPSVSGSRDDDVTFSFAFEAPRT